MLESMPTDCYICAMSLKLTFILMKAEKKLFSTELCIILSRKKIAVPKKADKAHKTLNVSSKDFENVIGWLKQ